MTRTGMKAIVAKVMTAGLLAGAVAMFAPSKAQAAEVAFDAQFGRPGAVAQRYDFDGRRNFYERERIERERIAEMERREAIRRHEEWMREHRFHEFHEDGWR